MVNQRVSSDEPVATCCLCRLVVDCQTATCDDGGRGSLAHEAGTELRLTQACREHEHGKKSETSDSKRNSAHKLAERLSQLNMYTHAQAASQAHNCASSHQTGGLKKNMNNSWGCSHKPPSS